MADAMRLDFQSPSHGWLPVRLAASDSVLAFTASSMPRDSIRDLACTVALSLAGDHEQVVVWNTEPAEVEFRFLTSSGRTRLETHEFPDARRCQGGSSPPTMIVEAEASVIALAVWRALRRLQGSTSAEEYATAWGHPFPSAVGRLEEALGRSTTGRRP